MADLLKFKAKISLKQRLHSRCKIHLWSDFRQNQKP